MVRFWTTLVLAMWPLSSGRAAAQEPDTPFGEGWERSVPVPMAKLGEGDRYIVWVEGGWLQARRETAAGRVDWHVVLARATGPEPPVVSAPQGTVRFEVSYKSGRYFVREDLNVLRCLRERKSGGKAAWPSVGLDAESYRSAGSAGSPAQPPMLRGWSGDDGFVVTSSPDPDRERYDCLVRLSPAVKGDGYGYEAMKGSLRRAFIGKDWALDDGELLVALRTLEAGLLAELEVGDPAPPLAATTLEGRPLRHEDYRGKYVLLDFWVTWCTPCVAEMPHLEEVYEAFGEDERFVMIGLSLDEEAEAAGAFVKDRHIPWAQVVVGEGSGNAIARDYGVESIPATFLIGPDGKVLATGMRGAAIREAVAEALGKP